MLIPVFISAPSTENLNPEQKSVYVVQAGISKPGVQDKAMNDMPLPTPWNHLEARILFSRRLPVLVFREKGISGGIFDEGVTDVFIHKMPSVADFEKKAGSVRQV
ncbi:hypothetical protein [Bradyrhizobium sp.]|uniref:hypothetical protein n=1 Tax=Bradyrhizobium sp. TaxID=376 RepID=UPI003BB12FB3